MHIASISKTITAMAIMTLVEDRGLDLDTPFLSHLNGRLPNAAPGVEKVTLRQLLRHQSGMVQWGGCGPDFWASMREYVKQPIERPPGSSASYSNGHFCLLRAVIETITGQQYVSYVLDNVLLPMGIAGMSCAPDASSGTVYYKKDDLGAHGYFWTNDYSGECSAYGWYTSAVDLAKYASGIRANVVLSPETTTLMLTGKLGFWSSNTAKGPAYHHNGGWVTGDARGYQGAMVLLPGGQNAVVLINTWAFDPIGPILDGFARTP
jgi:CubicO group peptidase (beta-lactamase class C family)